MTEKQFIARQEKFYETVRRLTNKLEDQRIEAAKTCTHEFAEPYTYETDNGYGRIGKSEGLKCRVCLARNPYPGISKRWITYEEWLRAG